MTYISASRLPVLPASPDASKPAPAPATSSSPTAKTTPAAAVTLSAAARKFVGGETNNVPWGNAPDR